MKALIETRNTRTERVFLVGVELKSRNHSDTSDSLAELGELATTAGGEVIGDGWQKVVSLNPATFIGAGSTIGGNVFLMESVAPKSLVIYGALDMRVLNRTNKTTMLDFQI